MTKPLTLSLHQIQTYLECPRRFELRYLERLTWPLPPADAADELAIRRGSLFHQAVERLLLGLGSADEEIGDETIRDWLGLFRAQQHRLAPGARYPEVTLTVPIGDHFLTGRFDLLVVNASNEKPAAHIYDWKTGKPRPLDTLRREWQTRLYLALLAAGGGALLPGGFAPESLSFTYWFLGEPNQPRVIGYSAADHTATWTELETIVAEIDGRLRSGDWPLTETLERCRRCGYQTYDGRQEAGAPLPPEPDEDAEPPATVGPNDAVEAEWN